MTNLKNSLYDASNFHALSQYSRIQDNQFSGKIPDYIQNWTSIKTLYACTLLFYFNFSSKLIVFVSLDFTLDSVIQGSGLSGPIPSGISLLTNLIDLYV